MDIDNAFADWVIKEWKLDQKMRPFLCYLSMASRLGHLCVLLKEGAMVPSPVDVWKSSEEDLIDEDQWSQAVFDGAKSFIAADPIVRSGNAFYLKKNWDSETVCVEQWRRLSHSEPTLKANGDFNQKGLLPEQAHAVECVLQQTVTCICGGPGTGKTYTAGQAVRILAELCERPIAVTPAAPTGKAAMHLYHSLYQILSDKVKLAPAQTLHRLLKVGWGREANTFPTVGSDVVVVDESAMIDATLMKRLLSAIKKGTRLVMMGDPRQLPPIDSGNVFADLVRYLEKNQLPFGHLKTCLRAESQAIISVAERVEAGEMVEFKEMDRESLLNEVSKRWKALLQEKNILESLGKFCLLTPMRKGRWGVDALNREIRERVPSNVYPIMITRNDAKRELYNGDMGVIEKKSGGEHLKAEDRAHLYRNGEVVSMPALLLPPYEWAYCQTVHKSQGSEYEEVFFVHPEGAEVFGKEVLYTAVTRAKKALYVWSSCETLCDTLKKTERRMSSIEERLGCSV